MNLRAYIEALAIERLGGPFYQAAGFPRSVVELAVLAFQERWPESKETAAIRRALFLFKSVGFIADDEPVEIKAF